MNIISKLVLLLTLTNSFICIGQNRHDNFLVNYVDSIKVEHALEENPLILFDGVSIDYKNIKEGMFAILKKEIHSAKYIPKEESNIYGSKGSFGVISLTSREHILKKLDHHFIHKLKRIYVLNNKVVSEHFINSFDRNKIQDVKVINELSKISEYTSENFDQLILISTKKNK